VTSWVIVPKSGNEVVQTGDATLFKMLASGSSEFDIMFVYLINAGGGLFKLHLHLYLGNERVRIVPLGFVYNDKIWQ